MTEKKSDFALAREALHEIVLKWEEQKVAETFGPRDLDKALLTLNAVAGGRFLSDEIREGFTA